MPEETFFQKHHAGVVAIWRRDTREWWRQHYIEVYTEEPPDGWWMDNPRTAAGGQIVPTLMRRFGSFDPAVLDIYFREMESRYRAEAGLPARGEGWVSETHLVHCVAEALPDHPVIREARPDWLAPQRLDIFVPTLALAIEYQGVQHYESVSLFGGDRGLENRREMDKKKREACRRAGVHLIAWDYDEPVSVEAVRERLTKAGVIL